METEGVAAFTVTPGWKRITAAVTTACDVEKKI